jgi:hypothetical protein
MRTEKTKILFLAICLVSAVMIFGCKKQGDSNSAGDEKNTIDSNAASSPARDENDTTVIAYYFHRTVRCAGCLEIEANAKRVIENSFANQIADKKLIWTSLNLDEPGGEAFAKEFDVSMSTLVLSKTKNGDNTQYRKLEKVWDFINTPKDFDAYVQNEVKQFLNE